MRRSRLLGLLAFLLYVGISYRYWGWRMVPHFTRGLMGETQDPLIFIWSFAWWPHALLHGLNPFVTHYLFAPEGINLTWTTSTPGLALAFAPVTLSFGPVAAFNLAALLLPPISSWTMYLLCRYLTGSFWASLFGGYLFGFSSYMLGQQQQGHLMLLAVFLLPLVVLVLVKFLRGELTQRGLAVRLGLLIAFQFSLSTEILLTLSLALVAGLALAFALVAEARPRLRAAIPPVAAGFGLALLFAAPLTLYTILGFQRKGFSAAEYTTTDVMDLIVPTHVNALYGGAHPEIMAHFDDVETTIYLGPPTLLIILLFAWRWRRSAWSRALVAAFLISLFVSFGPILQVNGRREAVLPMWVTRWLPGLNNIHFPRLSLYMAFAAALIVALWIRRTNGWVFARPYALPVLAVAAIAFGWWEDVNRTPHPQRVAFFTTGLYKSCIRNGDTIAIFPYGWSGESMLWQAETGFRFKIAEGYMEPLVFGAPQLTSFARDPVDYALRWIDYGKPTMAALLGFAERHDISRFVTVEGTDYPTQKQLRRIGPVQKIGGVLVAPACSSPPLSSRHLLGLERKVSHEGDKTIFYCDGATAIGLRGDLYPTGILVGKPHAFYVDGQGVTCQPPPEGYVHHGYAPDDRGVPSDTYPYYTSH